MFVTNRSPVCPSPHVSGCEMSHLLIWTSMFWTIDSCQHRVFADQCQMAVSWAQVYNYQLLGFNCSQVQVSFLGGIHFASCLWQKLKFFRKIFLKRSLESFAFGLARLNLH